MAHDSIAYTVYSSIFRAESPNGSRTRSDSVASTTSEAWQHPERDDLRVHTNVEDHGHPAGSPTGDDGTTPSNAQQSGANGANGSGSGSNGSGASATTPMSPRRSSWPMVLPKTYKEQFAPAPASIPESPSGSVSNGGGATPSIERVLENYSANFMVELVSTLNATQEMLLKTEGCGLCLRRGRGPWQKRFANKTDDTKSTASGTSATPTAAATAATAAKKAATTDNLGSTEADSEDSYLVLQCQALPCQHLIHVSCALHAAAAADLHNAQSSPTVGPLAAALSPRGVAATAAALGPSAHSFYAPSPNHHSAGALAAATAVRAANAALGSPLGPQPTPTFSPMIHSLSGLPMTPRALGSPAAANTGARRSTSVVPHTGGAPVFRVTITPPLASQRKHIELDGVMDDSQSTLYCSAEISFCHAVSSAQMMRVVWRDVGSGLDTRRNTQVLWATFPSGSAAQAAAASTDSTMGSNRTPSPPAGQFFVAPSSCNPSLVSMGSTLMPRGTLSLVVTDCTSPDTIPMRTWQHAINYDLTAWMHVPAPAANGRAPRTSSTSLVNEPRHIQLMYGDPTTRHMITIGLDSQPSTLEQGQRRQPGDYPTLTLSYVKYEFFPPPPLGLYGNGTAAPQAAGAWGYPPLSPGQKKRRAKVAGGAPAAAAAAGAALPAAANTSIPPRAPVKASSTSGGSTVTMAPIPAPASSPSASPTLATGSRTLLPRPPDSPALGGSGSGSEPNTPVLPTAPRLRLTRDAPQDRQAQHQPQQHQQHHNQHRGAAMHHQQHHQHMQHDGTMSPTQSPLLVAAPYPGLPPAVHLGGSIHTPPSPRHHPSSHLGLGHIGQPSFGGGGFYMGAFADANERQQQQQQNHHNQHHGGGGGRHNGGGRDTGRAIGGGRYQQHQAQPSQHHGPGAVLSRALQGAMYAPSYMAASPPMQTRVMSPRAAAAAFHMHSQPLPPSPGLGPQQHHMGHIGHIGQHGGGHHNPREHHGGHHNMREQQHHRGGGGGGGGRDDHRQNHGRDSRHHDDRHDDPRGHHMGGGGGHHHMGGLVGHGGGLGLAGDVSHLPNSRGSAAAAAAALAMSSGPGGLLPSPLGMLGGGPAPGVGFQHHLSSNNSERSSRSTSSSSSMTGSAPPSSNSSQAGDSFDLPLDMSMDALQLASHIQGQVAAILKTHKGSLLMQKYLESMTPATAQKPEDEVTPAGEKPTKPASPPVDKRVEGDRALFEVCWHEVSEEVATLMTNRFAQYAIERIIKLCTDVQRLHLLHKLSPDIVNVSCNMDGSFAVQALIDSLHTAQHVTALFRALQPGIHKLITSRSGYFVVLRCLERFGYNQTRIVDQAIIAKGMYVCNNRYGLQVFRQLVKVRQPTQLSAVYDTVERLTLELAQTESGNFVVQCVVDNAPDTVRARVLTQLCGHFQRLACHKFGSCVVEKCLKLCSPNPGAATLLTDRPHGPHSVGPDGKTSLFTPDGRDSRDKDAGSERERGGERRDSKSSGGRGERRDSKSNSANNSRRGSPSPEDEQSQRVPGQPQPTSAAWPAAAWLTRIVAEIIAPPDVAKLLKDRYGNYVLQTALSVASASASLLPSGTLAGHDSRVFVRDICLSICPHLRILSTKVRAKWTQLLTSACGHVGLDLNLLMKASSVTDGSGLGLLGPSGGFLPGALPLTPAAAAALAQAAAAAAAMAGGQQ